MRILIIEDEKDLADSLKILLERKGFETHVVCDGLAGEEYASLDIYDLVILDIMLPGQDGLKVVQHLRSRHLGIPVLILTAKSSLQDRIDGLNSGADYYLTKPFDTGELLACINALLRRQGTQIDELVFGNTSLELASGMLTSGNQSVRLTAREFNVMRILLQKPTQNHSKEKILSHVWGYESDAVENHVEVYVGFLRKKLMSIGSDISIVALRGLGYHLEVMKKC